MSTLEGRLLDPRTDAKGLKQLFRTVFGHKITNRMWQWKYRPPWSERHYCWVGRCDGKVIGYVGAVPLRGWVDGEEVAFFQLADVMVHPDYRLKFDYFSRSHEAISEGIKLHHPRHMIYGFSDHRLFRWFERTGWSSLIEKAVTRFLRPGQNGRVPQHDFREWKWKEPGVDALWEARLPTFRAGLVRDSEYLRWRYGSHPVYPYRLLGVYRDGAPVGWVVLSQGGYKKGTKPMPIVDLLVPEAASKDVLQDLSDHLGRAVKVWLPSKIAPEGAEHKQTNTHVYHFVTDSAVASEFLREHFYYTMGDVDWW